MKLTRIILFLFVASLLHSPSSAQHVKFSQAERTIIRLQDERRGIDTIARFLDSKDEKVAWRAAIALANIHDTNSRPVLLSHLAKETCQSVIDGVAFALGVFGADETSYNALVKKSALSVSPELCIALGRAVPKERAGELAALFENFAANEANALAISEGLIELGIRKIAVDNHITLAQKFEQNSNPNIRWKTIYGLARLQDSGVVARGIDILKTYLHDQGSPECRMFAATAIGSLKNIQGGNILIEAARSEVNWRVRVNIFNAIAKLPRFSSAIHEVLKKAVLKSSKEDPLSDHVARTALDILDQMIAAGKVSSPDSVTIREWLADYEPERELHQDQSLRIRSQCMIPLARLGADFERIKQICSFISFNDRTTESNVWKAVGVIPDTFAFYRLLSRVFTSTENNVVYVLDGLHSLWEIAKKDTAFMGKLERLSYAIPYRHMLIRFPSVAYDPAIIANSLEQIKDSTIITDSLRKEAEGYLLQYLNKYGYPKNHDPLTAVLSAIKWLKPKNDTIWKKILEIQHKAASEWGDQSLVDSAGATLTALGVLYKEPIVKLIRDPIDWKAIESLPDTMHIQTQYGFMYLKLKTYDAPLTALNMYKLAKNNFFANNYIHRVVPNFVIQSGDNTGTGEGGPGYAIRTEISPIRYDSAGVVGMASSGKDTEGSQWFITHCPTPHLNTRYTIWGEIVKGKEKIEKYMLNDIIENIVPYK